MGQQCPDARLERVYNDMFERWPALLASLGVSNRSEATTLAFKGFAR